MWCCVKLSTVVPSSGVQVRNLSWFNHILTSALGHSNGSIMHHNVHVLRCVIVMLQGHMGEMCGLWWSLGGEVLASGTNGNVVSLCGSQGSDVGSGT